ncbi:MAG: hypothetical protein NC548_57895, partial [Lachnospiraceae bacterium]|nr:hypothetical protein [Lachnospiraceae bacterium]
INNLRNDVQRLNTVLELIWGCPHIDRCPVKRGLLLPPKSGKRDKERGDRTSGYRAADGEPERERARGDPDEGERAAGVDGDGD